MHLFEACVKHRSLFKSVCISLQIKDDLTLTNRYPLHPGARCKVDRDCGASMCCARHHGEQVCKSRLIRGESCYVPDGGLAFSINQICPCDEGLLCREKSAPHRRERDFIYQPERKSWTCQVPKA
uniref:Dickkopf N-terminal cysteine-rich domain-containing protein n=1 Tax=Seriola dumerili TaxID=41447 RepID=A0A3B4UC23_SERDU